MSIIKITGSGAYEHTQETNHSLEYLKRTLTEHKLKPTLDHPDGSVTKEKLSAEVRDRMNKHESDIQEISNSKADKATVYTKSETDTILSTKADKATTYTIAQTDTILSTKADKADTYTKAEVDSIADDVKEKVDDYLIPETSSLSAQLIYVGEHKADRSELPTKVSQLENDKNYVIQEEIQPIYQDINYLDTQTRHLEAKKADKFDTYTATETDDMLSTKADKADLDWKLIGETETTEEYVESVILDFGEPIEKWYRETRMDIYIPKSSDLNNNNGAMCIVFSQSEADAGNIGDAAVNSGITLPLVASQSNNYAPMLYNYNYYGTVITEWDKNGKPIYSHILILGFGAKSYPYTAYGISRYQDNFNIKNKQFIALQNHPKTTFAFKFPAGTKISLYGRL